MAKERRTRCTYCADFLSVVHIFTCEEVPEKSYNILSGGSKNGMRTYLMLPNFQLLKIFLRRMIIILLFKIS